MAHLDVKRTHCSYVLYYSCIMVLCDNVHSTIFCTFVYALCIQSHALPLLQMTWRSRSVQEKVWAQVFAAVCRPRFHSLWVLVDQDSIHLKETVCFWINMFLSIAQCKLQPLACRQLPLLAAKSPNHQVLAPDPLGFHETPNCPPQKGCDSYIMDSGWSQRLMLDAKRLDS